MPEVEAFFGEPVRITIPDELVSEGALLTYLGLSERELKRI